MRIRRDNAPETIRECLALSKDGKLSFECPLDGDAGSQAGVQGAGGGRHLTMQWGL